MDTTQRVVDFAIERVKNADIIMDPFPHIIVDEILPTDVYEDMMRDVEKLDPIWRVFFKPHLKKGLKVRQQINVANEMSQEYSEKFFDIKSLQESLHTQAELLDQTSWKPYRELLAGKRLQVTII